MKELAISIVETFFAEKKDKGNNPYIQHLIRVSENSIKYFDTSTIYFDELEACQNKLEIIGLLHDLIEDCPEWTKKQLQSIFKDTIVVDAIEVLTKTSDISYEEYISKIKENDFAKAVKLADLKDNMDLTRLSKITEKDIERLKKYHESYVFLLA
jgi:guanosine-3',5'-bis(diphosphate) 3'-pyrophosphohydrolase